MPGLGDHSTAAIAGALARDRGERVCYRAVRPPTSAAALVVIDVPITRMSKFSADDISPAPLIGSPTRYRRAALAEAARPRPLATRAPRSGSTLDQ